MREIDTPAGPARAHLYRPDGPTRSAGTVLLGHGAGAGVESPDLQALTALTAAGWTVALLEQPWRVAGRRVATAPPTLDAATQGMVERLGAGRWALPRPWVMGGRSAGARVACRRAHQSGAAAVVALAFPLVPPSRSGPPARSRAAELLAPVGHGIPLLVAQGARDRFGGPAQVLAALADPAVPASARVEVQEMPGDHGPTTDPAALVRAVSAFLDRLP